jgi:hypothetical protein
MNTPLPMLKIDNENAIDGNFYQTENEYTILVYYKESIDRYERVIGKEMLTLSISLIKITSKRRIEIQNFVILNFN